jgi:hypothetical protein
MQRFIRAWKRVYISHMHVLPCACGVVVIGGVAVRRDYSTRPASYSDVEFVHRPKDDAGICTLYCSLFLSCSNKRSVRILLLVAEWLVPGRWVARTNNRIAISGTGCGVRDQRRTHGSQLQLGNGRHNYSVPEPIADERRHALFLSFGRRILLRKPCPVSVTNGERVLF